MLPGKKIVKNVHDFCNYSYHTLSLKFVLNLNLAKPDSIYYETESYPNYPECYYSK